MTGLCCANFSSFRGGWAPCRSIWCGGCYTPHPQDNFHQHVPTDESGYEWAKPIDKDKFKVARAGDHFMVPFQCDKCLARMLLGRSLVVGDRKDELLACCIRRANLDALWGRESSTVLANTRHLRQLLDTWKLVGIPPTLPPLGPFPMEDVYGVGVAIGMLLRSLNPGKYGDYTQFATIRKERSCYSNYFHASVVGASAMSTLGRDTAKSFLTTCPTQSLWFERFSKGCLYRMGEEVKQDLAISIEVMHCLMKLFNDEWMKTPMSWDKSEIASVALYCIIAFCGSFRGHEVFLVDLFGLLKYEDLFQAQQQEEYCMIPLLGKYKGESGERYHLTPLARLTKSGLNLGVWVGRVCHHRRLEGRTNGPVFADKWGNMVNPRHYEALILAKLQIIKESRCDLIPDSVNVYEAYGISRSFRRGSNTHSKNQGTNDKDIDLMNRWRNVENAKGRKARLAMSDHYADILQLIPALLRYSKNL